MPTTSNTSYTTRITQLHRRGKSASEIANTLNDEGITTARGKKWSVSGVYKFYKTNTKKRGMKKAITNRVVNSTPSHNGTVYNAVNTLLSSNQLSLEQKIGITNLLFGTDVI